jgi:signal transduction histidine kinase
LKKVFFSVFVLSFALSLVLFILSFILPTFISANYYRKSLGQLRHTKISIQKEFSHILDNIDNTQKTVFSLPIPTEKEDIFHLFKRLDLDPEKEGISYCDSSGTLVLWIGKIFDLNNMERRKGRGILIKERKSSLLIRNKASVYLVLFKRTTNGDYIVFFHLLAFLPRFKTPYLKEYHFLKQKLRENCSIEYWDFRDDVSVLEKIFSRHKDEYVGEPGLQGEIQTIVFPLRNEEDKIVATVNLSSPSLSSKVSASKEDILLVSYLLFGLSLVCLLVYLIKSFVLSKQKKILFGFLIILILLASRMLFLPLSQLERIQSLSIFSPASASFLSLGNLTKSPADIFLTAFFLFLITACTAVYLRAFTNRGKAGDSAAVSLAMNVIAISLSLFLLFCFQHILSQIIFHSNTNLVLFTLNPSFFLLHLSIFFFLLVFFLASFMAFRIAARYSTGIGAALPVFFLIFVVFVFICRNTFFPLLFVFQGVILVLLLVFAHFPQLLRKKEILFPSMLLTVLLIYSSVHIFFSYRNRQLVENFLQNIITSQETWGNYLISQSLPEIDKSTESITAFFSNPEPSNLAHSLWEETIIAKFNWYSSLELLSPESVVLSRFSLNVPELFQLEFDLPVNRDWSVSSHSLLFMGIKKDVLVAYKDWFTGDDHIGRTILYLSVDYDMLPFLYSANPYFELLRVSSLPSLYQLDLGFAIFDIDGDLFFNPNKISKGIPSSALKRIQSSPESFWAAFQDRNQTFNSLYFRKNDKIYSLFLPAKGFLDHAVDFLKIFFLYLFFSIVLLFSVSILSNKKRIKNPLWSFSNRVYISFVAVALIPLFLFAFSTRTFFNRMFAQQMTDKAEIHANFARRVVEDFIGLQQEEQLSLTLPPDNVMLLISSTISNDVNLYQDGRLISSSRREFFDYGILPDTIDGEVFYKIQYENDPFYSQTQKIGDYSFHTLTIPYPFQNSLLLISLPFPLEQQEIDKATRELLEFLFFLSSFFIFFVVLFARGIGGTIIHPIKKLLAGTKEVSLGNLEVSIPHEHEDEMKTLIDGFNSMVKNLKKHQQEMAEMSKKVAWAEMARKVAHEIKNPLTPIQLSAEHLERVFHDKREDFEATLQESTSYIIKEVENLRQIAKEFLEISKETALQKEVFNLKDTIQETILPYKKVISERISLREAYDGENFLIRGDKSKIKIALRNIFTNALEAIGSQGQIGVKVTSSKAGITVSIADSGAGIDEENLHRIFEPYFSTKDVGTGLGLSIAKKIIEDHRGKIQAASKKNEGTIITIFLPQVKSTEEAETK